MTLLATLVATSRQVAETSARSAKTRLLADCLRMLDAEELEIAVTYLSGEIRQGRIGIGPAALRANVTEAAVVPTLKLTEVDHALEELKEIRGDGSTARRAEALRALFGRATRDEQPFLLQLTKEFQARDSHHDEWIVYVRPEIVVEIAFSDLQQSARYPGGLALRLARVKAYRPDKRVEEADNMDTVRKIFAAQSA